MSQENIELIDKRLEAMWDVPIPSEVDERLIELLAKLGRRRLGSRGIRGCGRGRCRSRCRRLPFRRLLRERARTDKQGGNDERAGHQGPGGHRYGLGGTDMTTTPPSGISSS